MALTLLVRSGDGSNPARITFDAPRIVIGRGEGCEVRLPDPSVSHRHASIRQRGTEYIVLDEGSSNGTFVGPVRLSPQAPRVVRSGDLVRVGRIWLEISVGPVPPTENAPLATRELALSLIRDALAAEGEKAGLRVKVVEGPGAGAELVLAEPGHSYVAGRSPAVDLNLDDEDLSRRHVELVRRADRLIVRDLGSKNGTRVGERTLASKEEAPWPKGESLFIGKCRLVYEDPVGEALEELEQAPDERIKDTELIEPPTGATELPEASKRPSSRSRAGAEKAELRAARSPSQRPSPPGWTLGDVLVASLAIVVIGLSVAALLWIMRAG